MKTMTVVVDLSDLWAEEGDSVASVLGHEVRSAVVRRLADEMKAEISTEIKDFTKEILTSEDYREKVYERLTSRLEEIELKAGYGKRIKLNKYIDAEIKDCASAWSKRHVIKDKIDRSMKALEKQYNEQFAVGIIKKLKEANMLTQEARNLLAANEQEGEK